MTFDIPILAYCDCSEVDRLIAVNVLTLTAGRALTECWFVSDLTVHILRVVVITTITSIVSCSSNIQQFSQVDLECGLLNQWYCVVLLVFVTCLLRLAAVFFLELFINVV